MKLNRSTFQDANILIRLKNKMTIAVLWLRRYWLLERQFIVVPKA